MTEDYLFTIAEIAVALIGFSGIVTVLGRRAKGDWKHEERVRLLALTEPSAIALSGSLLAATLLIVLPNDNLLWRISNGAVLALHLLAFTAYVKRSKNVEQLLSQKLMTVVAVLIFIALAGSVLNVNPYHEMTFALGVLLGIAVGVFNFTLLLFRIDSANDN
ncbi:MAG: hypothetical protein AB8B95_14860 [Pseudohongiellaceae bacterium]